METTHDELTKARAIMRSGHKVLFHSGLSSDAEDIGRYGLIPSNDGPWVREVANSAFDNDVDVEQHLEKAVPIVWLSDEPTWVNIKSQRSSGNSVGVASQRTVLEHAHLALVNADDYADEIFYVGEDGLNNGPYSTVWDVRGKAHKFYETNLYAFDDETQSSIEPFGIERNEWISASDLEVVANLRGSEVIAFMREFYPTLITEADRPRPMTPADYRESGPTLFDRTDKPEGQYIEGDHADEMTPEQARQYLDRHPNGTLHHDWFETDAFITRDINGNYLFYNPQLEQRSNPGAAIELWTWDFLDEIRAATRAGDPDIETGWWYHPGREMDMINGGIEWWEAVRNGDYTKGGQRSIG